MKRLPDATLKAIGAEIRRRREAADLTLGDLGDRAELHKQYIARLEAGTVDFSISVLFSVADALGCDVTALLPAEEGTITPEILAIARRVADIDPSVRPTVETLLSHLPSGRRRRRSGG